ncbi:MAG: C-5 sterol desaturase, partial [Bacteroidota bacterium]
IWNDFKKAKKWSHKFMYVFGPPGWSHDGSTLTVKQQQAEFAEQKKLHPKIAFQRPN